MATFTVSNTNASGSGSLRDAIDQANLDAAADVVVFAPGVTGAINLAATGSLQITEALTITGPGAGLVTIVADADSQVFDIFPTAPVIETAIVGLTLTGVNGLGAGAIVAGDTNLRLSGVTISGNVADPTGFSAGAIVIASAGDLTIENSTITGNSGLAGGIVSAGAGRLIIRGSSITGNTGDVSAGGSGGVFVVSSGPMTVENSTIGGNAGLVGGILYGGNGGLTIRNSTISGNTGDMSGGGGPFPLAGGVMYLGPADMLIEASTISGNSVGGGAGGVSYFGDGTATISATTISGNSGAVGGAAVTSGFTPYTARAVFTNVTVVNNATDLGGGAAGGVIFDSLASSILRNSTVANNTDPAGTALAEGVVSLDTALDIQNSIIWTAGGIEDLYYDITQITANYSLIGSFANCLCTLPLDVLANLFGVDPMLGALTNNGGPVPTMLPLAGSPAINAGNPAHDVFTQPWTDARGYYRVAGRIDMGAAEVGSTLFGGLPLVPGSNPNPTSAQAPPPSQAPAINGAFANLLRFQTYGAFPPLPTTVTTPEGKLLPNPLLAQQLVVRAMVLDVDAGRLTLQQARDLMVDMADGTTSVATMGYQFFTGKIPSKEGLDYLVSSPQNPNDFNDGFYAGMSLENRYINMAVSLGKPPAEGAAGFAAAYGALSLTDAAAKAYAEIFGPLPAGKVDAILTPERIAYFNSLGGDPLGAKAAMVGWLLAESAKSDVGRYAVMNENFLYDMIDGVAAFGADMSIYVNAGPRSVGLVGVVGEF